MHRFRVGDLDLAVVSDGTMPLPAEALFPPAKKSEWQTVIETDASGLFVAALNCLLIRSANQTVLIDNGASNKPTALRRAPGLLLGNLAAAGIEPGDINLVVITHGNWDHYGWNTREVGGRLVPTFPKATYSLSRADWEYYSAPDRRTPFFEESFMPLREAGVLELTDTEERITSEMRRVPAPGHTPGQTCIVIESGGHAAMHLADLVHHQSQVEHPDWVRDADAQPELVPDTRSRLFRLAAELNAQCVISHVRYPSAGRVVPRANGYTYQFAPE